MIFLVQFGKNNHLLVFKKFTRAYLFQIALEIMWLSIQITLHSVQLPLLTQRERYGPLTSNLLEWNLIVVKSAPFAAL